MKLKSLAMIIATGGLLAGAGPSFAAPSCSTVTTFGGWAGLGATGCVDPADGDTLWVVTSSAGMDPSIGFKILELEAIGSTDFYTLALDWTTTTAGQLSTSGATFSFTVTSLNTEQFIAANFGTTGSEGLGTSGATANANINSGTLTLTSTDFSQSPPSGETLIPGNPYQSLSVTDTFRPDLATPFGTALQTGADNSFQISTPTAPEPASLLLMGVGLAALATIRRRRQGN